MTSLHGRRPKGKERGKTSGWSARRSDVGGSFLLPPSLLFPALVLTFYGLPRRLSSDLTLPWSWEREDVAFYVATKTKTWVILCIAWLRDLQSETSLPCSKEKRFQRKIYLDMFKGFWRAPRFYFFHRKLNHCFWRGKHDLIYHRKGIPVNTILLSPSAHSMADARHNTLFRALNIAFRLQNQLLFCTDTKI